MLAIVALALTPLAAQATTVDFEVMSAANSSNDGTGLTTSIFLTVGDAFSVTADYLDTWVLGSTLAHVGNADGLTSFSDYTLGNLTTLYGTLVGMIGAGDFFAIGTYYFGNANVTGELKLFNWDSYSGDNTGSITATVYVGVDLPEVPLPATGLLLVGALGGFGLARRKRKTA